MNHLTLLLFIPLFIFSCQSNQKNSSIDRGFYYWKTNFHISPAEKDELSQLRVQKLFIRLFDIDWDEESAQAVPRAKITLKESIPVHQVIPVIYITNKTFLNLKKNEVPRLASQVGKAIHQYVDNRSFSIKEIQFDCDWSEKSKAAYFLFLKEIKKQFNTPIILSSTIRLHQIKYSTITGIPPVEKGILMFYNMGSLKSKSESNSIFNEPDAAKYIQQVKTYPLKLDVALPVFSWAIQIRNGKIINLLNKESNIDFQNDSLFEKLSNNYYVASKSFFHNGQYIKKEDNFRIEKLEENDLVAAAEMISKELKPENRTVILFDLDSENLANYEKEILEEVYNCFN
jgi:hypothetical protein